MTPFFSIITPTLRRPSLSQCIRSICDQHFMEYEHILQADCEYAPAEEGHISIHPDLFCGFRHNNFGNTCRHIAWERATGQYIIHLDDDNYLADDFVLGDIYAALTTSGLPDWACFPINRFGYHFFNAEPRSCHADTANIVVKREYGRWPDRPEYTADGFWMEGLRDHQPPLTFAAFPDFRPIIVMPQQGKGEL